MKKLIVILTIIMCASFVFGASLGDIHNVKLKTNVGSISPEFEFVFNSGMKIDEEAEEKEIVAKYDENGFHSSYNTEETALEVADISKDDLKLIFTARLSNEAKSTKIYTLRLIASGFAVTRNEAPGTLEPSSTIVVPSSTLANRAGVSAGIIKEDSIQMVFTGDVCNPGDLATFTVNYQADSELDPSDDGFYYANIAFEVRSI